MLDALFDLVEVRCCFRCGHLAQGTTPLAAHAAMEAHYATAHAALIARLTS